jgi:uncharacterized damage-inducible protein DinB
MALYNRWQNGSLYAAADPLSDAARRQDRGAFFKSIHATLNHLLWADNMWMKRLANLGTPAGKIVDSTSFIDEWDALKRERAAFDELIVAWANRLDRTDLEGDLAWRSNILGADAVRPRWLAIVHFFNHQTHHRGQVHAMLTAAGAKPQDTDLILLRGSDEL